MSKNDIDMVAILWDQVKRLSNWTRQRDGEVQQGYSDMCKLENSGLIPHLVKEPEPEPEPEPIEESTAFVEPIVEPKPEPEPEPEPPAEEPATTTDATEQSRPGLHL